MNETPNSEDISTRLDRIAQLAKKAPELSFKTLAHHIDEVLLHECVARTRQDTAVGVDGQTADEYKENLSANLRSLIDRFKSGTYKAPPVKRAYIPKAGGKVRPIGIPTFEDKLLQRAVVTVLTPIYEQDFHPNSFGFRPGRSAHQALEKLWQTTMRYEGGWVLEADIEDFFGTLKHDILRAFLDLRIRDGVIRRTIHKWLNAGVMEEGRVKHPETGTPQGGVVSPLLANIYLHYVLDAWFEAEVKPRLRGNAELIRFADDFVIVFQIEQDAVRALEVLHKRFGKYGLRLHPEKTRLIDFRKPPDGGGSTFDLLGFTHYWSTSRKGRLFVTRKTGKDRLRRTLAAITEWCQDNRHKPVSEQHATLTRKLQGHYNYYGITGNIRAISRFRYEVERIWLRWLSRRSQKGTVPWARFHNYLITHPLPRARIVHSAVRP